MGFPLLQKSGEMCVGRQIKVLDRVDPTGKGTCQMKNRIHSTSVQSASIMSSTVQYSSSTGLLYPMTSFPHHRNFGQYTVIFKCNIEDVTGTTEVCGAERHDCVYYQPPVRLISHVETWQCPKSVHHMLSWMVSSSTRSRIMSM